MVLIDYSMSDEEFDMAEDEDIAMLLLVHKNKKPKHGGSVFGCEKIWRLRLEADNTLMRNYLGPNPTFPERIFRRRFRMSTELFRTIAERMKIQDRFFQQRRSASGELGHSTYQKVTAALRQMAYGIPADLVDDHLAMSESQSIKCVKHFAVAMVQAYAG
jgi:hypothetical protein